MLQISQLIWEHMSCPSQKVKSLARRQPKRPCPYFPSGPRSKGIWVTPQGHC